jgi:hypothetical protein
MLNKVFDGSFEEAKVTIEIGDYKVTMEGQMEPPTVKTERFERGLYLKEASNYGSLQEVLMKIRPKGQIDIKQWRWTIPLSTPPRIEQ